MKKIKLTKGFFAIVDNDDYEYIKDFRWFASKSGNKYRAEISIFGGHMLMHQMIMNPKKGQDIDHINRDSLDNRKCNLRICTHQQNMCNIWRTNKIKGIRKRSKKTWQARIKVKYKEIYLGSFKTEKEAALAYNQAAIKYFGEFACLNKLGKI